LTPRISRGARRWTAAVALCGAFALLYPRLARADAPSAAAPPAAAMVVAPGAAERTPEVRLPDLAVLSQRGPAWDLTLRGGYAVAGCCIDTRFTGGARAGVAYWSDPMVYVLGATFDAGAIAGAAVGAEAAILDVAGGLWASVGVAYAWEGRAPLVSAWVGWALFGVHYQFRADPGAPQQHAVTLGISVPLGVLVSRILWQSGFRARAP
jgi:hypothetical protein